MENNKIIEKLSINTDISDPYDILKDTLDDYDPLELDDDSDFVDIADNYTNPIDDFEDSKEQEDTEEVLKINDSESDFDDKNDDWLEIVREIMKQSQNYRSED